MPYKLKTATSQFYSPQTLQTGTAHSFAGSVFTNQYLYTENPRNSGFFVCGIEETDMLVNIYVLVKKGVLLYNG